MQQSVLSQAFSLPDGAAQLGLAEAGATSPATVSEQMHWVFERFDALGVHALHDALALRCRVFILEQGAYQDPDGADKHSWHLLGYCPSGVGGVSGDDGGVEAPLAACLRIVDPGARFIEPSIGRVVVAPEWRGVGLGRALVRKALQDCEALWPGRPIRISAQVHLEAFYASLGFASAGQPYTEDDIPHVEMLRLAQQKETV